MNQLLADPLFASFAIGAVLLAGLSKGGFGGGVGFVGVLALAQVSSPIQAVAIMLPILCVMDPMGVWAYRKDWHRSSMKVLGIGCLIGTVIGMLTFKWMDDQLIRLMVGVIAVAFFIDFFRAGGEKAAARTFSDPVGYVLGTISGFTSFVIHAGLPPDVPAAPEARQAGPCRNDRCFVLYGKLCENPTLLVAGTFHHSEPVNLSYPASLGADRHVHRN